MGTLTQIEEALANLVERPFRVADTLDSMTMEIALKRLMEKYRRDILGRLLVPNIASIKINADIYAEYEPFFDEIREYFSQALISWIKENEYRLIGKLHFDFISASIDDKVFEISVAYGKTEVDDPGKADPEDNAAHDSITAGTLVHGQTGEHYALRSGQNLLGRSHECAVRLCSQTISSEHALIICMDGIAAIKDLQSSNGTRVNLQKTESQVLKDGDIISLGDIDLQYREMQVCLQDLLPCDAVEEAMLLSMPDAMILIPDMGLRNHHN